MQIEIIKLLHDFQKHSLTETVNLILKLVTVYFALLAGSLAYVFSSSIETALKETILFGLLISSTLFLVAIIALGYGVVLGLKDLKNGIKSTGKKEYKAMNMSEYFQRGRNVIYIVLVSCICIVLTIFFILLYVIKNNLIPN